MSRGHEKGAQAVEFALVFPFLVLVIFAVLDFGIIVYNKAIITNASREAARAGSMLTATWDPDAVRQVACNYTRSSVISVGTTGTRTSTCSGTDDPVIEVSPAAAPAFSTPVTVTVTYVVRGFSLGSWWSLGTSSTIGSPFTLTATTQMNHE